MIPTQTQSEQDRAVFYDAVSQAVKAAINSDEFKNAIAGQLTTRNPTSPSKMSAVDEKLDSIAAGLRDLKEEGPAPIRKALVMHAEKMDSIAASVTDLKNEGPSPIRKALMIHAAKLDDLAAEVKAIREQLAQGSRAA